jgi:uroporphyrinogen III methyltransferase/synthase
VLNPSSPLAGKRFVITRAAEQAEALSRALRAHGAIPVLMPLIAFAVPLDSAPFDAAIRKLGKFDWILLTSQNAVRAVAERCRMLGVDLRASGDRLRVGVVGPATGEAAEKVGMKISHSAKTHQAAALAEELGGQLQDATVFLPRSDRANPELTRTLRRVGARVTDVIAYRTIPAPEEQDESRGALERGEADAILFFSPSAVYQMAELLGQERLQALQGRILCAAIGPVTAAALRGIGIERVLVASDTSISGILDSLAEHWQAGTQAEVK